MAEWQDGAASLSDRPVLRACLGCLFRAGEFHRLGRDRLSFPTAPEGRDSAQMKAWAPAVTYHVPKPAVCAWPGSSNKESRPVGVRDGLSCCAENAACVTGCSSPRHFGMGCCNCLVVLAASHRPVLSLHTELCEAREQGAASHIHHRGSQNSDQVGSSLVCFRERFLMPGLGYGSWRKGAHEKCVSAWLREWFSTEWMGVAHLNMISIGNSLEVRWLRQQAFTARGPGLIPGRETKIPQALWHGLKENKISITSKIQRGPPCVVPLY